MGKSRLLSEMKMERIQSRSGLDPALKIAAAFSLSMESRKLLIAGLQSQGFSETEIRQILKRGQR
jgi:hypothetical protein